MTLMPSPAKPHPPQESVVPTSGTVSIVINNCNYGRFIKAAIDSALAQTYRNVEVIVVDDGSSDDSRSIIAAYANRVITILKPNGGQASAFNAGIRSAKGQFTLLLDSDDFLFPDAVETCLAKFPRGYSRVYFRLRLVDDNGTPISASIPANRFELLDGDVFDQPCAAEPVFVGPPTSGNFFSTLTLRAVLPIPETEYRICADAYVLVKTSLLGPVKGIDRELGAYRIHGENAFSFQRSLYSNPRRVNAQVVNYFTTARLFEEASAAKGRRWRSLPPYMCFWTLHLVCAAHVWKVGTLDIKGMSSSQLMTMTAKFLVSGRGGRGKRLIQAAYLIALTMLPRPLSRQLLACIDQLKFRRERLTIHARRITM